MREKQSIWAALSMSMSMTTLFAKVLSVARLCHRGLLVKTRAIYVVRLVLIHRIQLMMMLVKKAVSVVRPAEMAQSHRHHLQRLTQRHLPHQHQLPPPLHLSLSLAILAAIFHQLELPIFFKLTPIDFDNIFSISSTNCCVSKIVRSMSKKMEKDLLMV